MISPVVNPNTRTVFAYFPKARWFDFYTGLEIPETGRIHEIDAPSDYLPLHIRGDSLLVTQEPANNTHYSRMNSFGLIIAPGLNKNTIQGSLYWDAGEEIGKKHKAHVSTIHVLGYWFMQHLQLSKTIYCCLHVLSCINVFFFF